MIVDMRGFFLLLTMASLLLPAESGRLQIRVTDPTSAVVPDSEIVVTATNGKALRTRTDGAGVASFDRLAAGDYQLSVSKAGFKVWTAKQTIPTAGAAPVEAKLELGIVRAGNFVTEEKPKSLATKFKNWLTSCTRK